MPIDFVKTGKSKAVVSVTLINKGKGSYKRDIFGDAITIERTISASTGTGGYRILNEHRIIIVKFFKVLVIVLYVFRETNQHQARGSRQNPR